MPYPTSYPTLTPPTMPQVLSAGRIPAQTDTDTLLPLDQDIRWSECALLESTPQRVLERILDVWKDGDAIERRQWRCAQIHTTHFASSEVYVRWLLTSIVRQRDREQDHQR